MPDITLCTNDDCVLSSTCRRHLLEPDMIQSYSYFEPTDGYCEYYLKVEE